MPGREFDRALVVAGYVGDGTRDTASGSAHLHLFVEAATANGKAPNWIRIPGSGHSSGGNRPTQTARKGKHLSAKPC